MTKTKHNLEKILDSYSNVYYKNSDITSKNFPVPDVIQTENWKLIKMDRSFSSQEALDRIKKEGCRPANIYELLLWAKDNQEKSQWVVGFGSEWTDSDGDRRVPCVYRGSDGDWEFDLGRFGHGWDGDLCLLCVCDSTQSLSTLETENLDTLKLDEAIKVVKDAGYTVYKEI